MNAKRETYNKTATTATPDDCRMTAERKPTPPPRRVPDEIERKIFDSEYAHDVTLRQLYGNLSLDEIMLIPKFKRDNRILCGLLAVTEFELRRDDHNTHGMIDKFIFLGAIDNVLRDFPLIRLYESVRKILPAASTNAAILAAILANAETAVRNTEAIRADLDGWREYVKNLLDASGETDADDETTKKKRGKNLATYKPELGFEIVKTAIVKVWDDFRKGDADCEMPDSTLRVRGQGRSYAECIDRCGDTIIWKGQTLRELLTVPQSKKSPAEVFEKIVHSSSESARQKAPASDYSAKPPQKKKQK